MWIKNRSEDTIYNFDLCERITVLPGEMNYYNIVVYQNGNKHYLGSYKTEEEAKNIFQRIISVIACNGYMLTID